MLSWCGGYSAGFAWGCLCSCTHVAGRSRMMSVTCLAVGHGNQLGCLCSFHISLIFFSELDWISYVAAPSQCSKKARHNAHLPLKPLFADVPLAKDSRANPRVNVKANIQAYGYM